MTETNISTARVPQVTVIDPRIPEKAKLRVAAVSYTHLDVYKRQMENYCSGVYLSPNQVLQILRDLEQEPRCV